MEHKTVDLTKRPQGDRCRWLILALAFVALCLIFTALLPRELSPTTNVDLAAFYAASVQVFSNGLPPYDVTALASLRGDGGITPPYLYPPTNLLILSPLSLLTWDEAQRWMWNLNLALLAITAWLLPLFVCQINMGKRVTISTVCLAGTILFGPVVVTMHHGQINLLLLLCLASFWALSRSGRSILAAVFLSVAVLCKTYPILLVPALFLIGKRRDAAYACVFLAIAVALSLLILPQGSWSSWITQVAPSGAYTLTPQGLHQPAAIWNQSLNGIVCRLCTENEWTTPIIASPLLALIFTYGVTALVITLATLSIWRCRHFADSLDRMMLIALPTMYLVAPLSWEHHLVYLLPVLMFLFTKDLSFRFGRRWAVRLLAAAMWVILAFPLLLAFKGYTVIALWILSLFATRTRTPVANETVPSGA